MVVVVVAVLAVIGRRCRGGGRRAAGVTRQLNQLVLMFLQRENGDPSIKAEPSSGRAVSGFHLPAQVTQADLVKLVVFPSRRYAVLVIRRIILMILTVSIRPTSGSTIGRRRPLAVIPAGSSRSPLLLLLEWRADQVLVIVLMQRDGVVAALVAETGANPRLGVAGMLGLVVRFVTLDAAVERFGRIDRLGHDSHHFLTSNNWADGGHAGRMAGQGGGRHFVDGSERQVHHSLDGFFIIWLLGEIGSNGIR